MDNTLILHIKHAKIVQMGKQQILPLKSVNAQPTHSTLVQLVLNVIILNILTLIKSFVYHVQTIKSITSS